LQHVSFAHRRRLRSSRAKADRSTSATWQLRASALVSTFEGN
jgi:hypothetical protein